MSDESKMHQDRSQGGRAQRSWKSLKDARGMRPVVIEIAQMGGIFTGTGGEAIGESLRAFGLAIWTGSGWTPTTKTRHHSVHSAPAVYFVQSGLTGPIKIGFTRLLERRLATIQTGTHEQVRLLASIVGGRPKEAEIHKRFEHLKIKNEWFRPESELLDFIRTLPEMQ